MTSVTDGDIIGRFGEEIAGALGAMTGTTVSAHAGGALPAAGYRAIVSVTEGGRGALHVQVDEAGARALARRAGGDETASSDALLALLQDLCRRAGASFVTRPGLEGTQLAVESEGAASEAPDVADAVPVQLVIDGDAEPIQLAIWGTLEPGHAAQPRAEISGGPGREAPAGPGLDVILDMDLPLVVRFGRAEMTLKSLASLAPGASIDLGRSPDDPVEVLVSNRVVARGEVVTVAGNYGVRITDVISPAERVRYMEVAS